jgi:hypothetical protein
MSRRDDIKDVANSIPFDNSSNGFISDNAQSAIEEAKQNSEGFPRAGIVLIANGVVSNNQFISYSDLLPNTPVGPFPVKLKLNELMWSNTNLNVSFDLLFYLNGSATPFYTYSTVSDADGMGYASGLSFSFAVGDYIKIKYVDQGTNASDMALVLWVSRIP